MRLVEQGKVDLDADVNQYLKDFNYQTLISVQSHFVSYSSVDPALTIASYTLQAKSSCIQITDTVRWEP